jgi:hypothetical protein
MTFSNKVILESADITWAFVKNILLKTLNAKQIY